MITRRFPLMDVAPDALTFLRAEGRWVSKGLKLFIRGVSSAHPTLPLPPPALDRHELLTHLQLPDIHICRKLLRQRLAEQRLGGCSGGGRGNEREVVRVELEGRE